MCHHLLHLWKLKQIITRCLLSTDKPNKGVFCKHTSYFKAISELYNIDRTVVTKHLKNIFDDYELDKSSVCAIYAHTAKDGKTYKTNYYNLDAVISVGYRK